MDRVIDFVLCKIQYVSLQMWWRIYAIEGGKQLWYISNTTRTGCIVVIDVMAMYEQHSLLRENFYKHWKMIVYYVEVSARNLCVHVFIFFIVLQLLTLFIILHVDCLHLFSLVINISPMSQQPHISVHSSSALRQVNLSVLHLSSHSHTWRTESLTLVQIIAWSWQEKICLLPSSSRVSMAFLLQG